MGKRGALRRLPGEEPDFPAVMCRPYRAPPLNKALPDVDVAAIRKQLGLSQARFAHRFGFSVGTLRHWEQGKRKPLGCALALLHVIAYQPAAATRAIIRARQPSFTMAASPGEPQWSAPRSRIRDRTAA